MPEAELYGPIKLFLEAQGYVVKGEIGACDVMAVKGDEGPVVVELKERLSLALILQAADRLAFSDTVYVAFRIGQGQSASWRRHCQVNESGTYEGGRIRDQAAVTAVHTVNARARNIRC